ncbi:hypothetical protein SMD22_00880 (plasmid) [Brevibacillus halotolerans]|nr:hypothetical protein SMD22_00880 [Brevibacillus halotolerans]
MKALSILFFTVFEWHLLLAVNEKAKILQMLGLSDHVYRVGTLSMGITLCIALNVATFKWAKKFESPLSDFGYTILLGAFVGMIAKGILDTV